jgi:hypothetical protein
MSKLQYIITYACAFYFQNPGFDFSHAKLSKSYDSLPGWSLDAVRKKDEKKAETETLTDS